MPPQPGDARLFTLQLRRGGRLPLHRQIYVGLRDRILEGALAPGTRMPSTRGFASDLAVSRNTVLQAFGQLMEEGFLQAEHGGGTYVASTLPSAGIYGNGDGGADSSGVVHGGSTSSVGSEMPAGAPRRVSSWAEDLEAIEPWSGEPLSEPRPFEVGTPDLDAFPAQAFARAMNRAMRSGGAHTRGYVDPMGWRPLREALALHLRHARGVRAEADRVLITSGSQQALDLCARVLLNRGDRVWIEHPGYIGALQRFSLGGLRPVYLDVDEEGMRLDQPAARRGRPRLVYVTPSHQFPLGVTLSLARRLELLHRARERGFWILEDDYDSEFRYSGAPILSLQGLDRGERVLYTGTFSKTLAPGLRVGYMVLPEDLVEPFRRARFVSDLHAPVWAQMALASFLEEGRYAGHVRAMRRLYGRRREHLIGALGERLGDRYPVRSAAGGMQLLLELPDGVREGDVAAGMRSRGFQVTPLGFFARKEYAPARILLGYAAFAEEKLDAGVSALAETLGEHAGASGA